MTTFVLLALAPDGRERNFLYSNSDSTLVDLDAMKRVTMFDGYTEKRKPYVFTPTKSRQINTLKIQLGLSCNYSCTYCVQRFVPFENTTSAKDIALFMEKISNLDLAPDARIEFWGGEPLVYWKTLLPLAEALRKKYPTTSFSIITNGSLLDHLKALDLIRLGFSIAISHDGPGQSVRGEDPFHNPEFLTMVRWLVKRLVPENRFSINVMMNKNNASRAKVQRYFLALLQGDEVPLGEGMFIDAYDEGGVSMSLKGDTEHYAFRQLAYNEIVRGEVHQFISVTGKIVSWMRSVDAKRRSSTVGQKCGMDRPDQIAVTLAGDVVTCQNVSIQSSAPNGESHHIGRLEDLEDVRLDTARHWSTRDHCKDCPVLQLCKGSCMFLEGHEWDITCSNAYSDNIVFLAAAFNEMTGCTLKRIDPVSKEVDLPESRRDVFGPTPKKLYSTIPIKAIA